MRVESEKVRERFNCAITNQSNLLKKEEAQNSSACFLVVICRKLLE